MPTIDEIKQRIEREIPDARAQVDGDGHHFSATVVSPRFEGLSRIEQHRMVQQVFDGELGGRIHALSIKTKPD